MEHIVKFILFFSWTAGIVIAQGFWSTTIALFIPLWAWYLTVEKILTHFSIL